MKSAILIFENMLWIHGLVEMFLDENWDVYM